MSFSSVDGGRPAAPHAAPRVQPSFIDTSKPTAKAEATYAPFDANAGLNVGNPAGNYDPNPTIPTYTPGPLPNGDFTPGGYSGGITDPGALANLYSGSVDQSPFPAKPAATLDINTLLQKALGNLGFSQLDSSLQKAREQLITRFGDASLASMAGFGLDPQAGAFAQQNYLSGNADLARLDKQREKDKQAVINRLVSHGLLNSGDLGHGLSEAESNYGNQRYDLTQSYLQKLSDLLSSTLSQKQQLRSNVVNALLSAYGSQVQNPEDLIGLYGG